MSAVAGAGLYAVHPEPGPAAVAFLAGTLVDADHFFDLWKYRKHRRPGEKVLEVIEAHTWVNTFILLHALEYIPLLATMIFVGPQPWIWGGILLGYGLHLAMDMLGNRGYPLTYFLSYRIYRGFDARRLWTDSRPRGLHPSRDS